MGRNISCTGELKRFEQITDDPALIERFESLLKEKNLSREELATILFTIRVRHEFGRRDFGI
jgi:hypothetical protein